MSPDQHEQLRLYLVDLLLDGATLERIQEAQDQMAELINECVLDERQSAELFERLRKMREGAAAATFEELQAACRNLQTDLAAGVPFEWAMPVLRR